MCVFVQGKECQLWRAISLPSAGAFDFENPSPVTNDHKGGNKEPTVKRVVVGFVHGCKQSKGFSPSPQRPFV